MENKKYYLGKKIAVSELINFENFKKTTGAINDDFIQDRFFKVLQNYIYERMLEEREIEYEFKPPTLLEFLFRKKRKVKIIATSKEIFKNPPKDEKGYLIINDFEIKQDEISN